MPKLTHKQEKFARNIVAKEMTQTAAYKDAYDCEDMSEEAIRVEACKLAKTPKVALTMDKLREEYAEYFNYDAKTHFEDLKKRRDLAETPSGEHGNINLNASIRATELMGKMTGKYVDRTEIEANVTGSINVNIVTGK